MSTNQHLDKDSPRKTVMIIKNCYCKHVHTDEKPPHL